MASQPSSGYDISASLSGSSSAGASLSGATSQGGNYNFGTAYGPGGLILNDQRGSIGASAGASGLIWIVIIAAVAGIAFFFPRR